MTAESHGREQSGGPVDPRTLVETIPALVVCVLADGTSVFMNREWQEYAGVSHDQLTKRGWTETIHPEDAEKFDDEWLRAFAAGKHCETEARLRRADGQYRWFSIKKAVAVTRNQQGEATLCALVACEDIHERMQAQRRLENTLQDLRASEGQLQAFLENSPNLIFLKDSEGRYLYVNKEFTRALGCTDEGLKGKRDDELFPAEQAAAFQANDQKVVAAGVAMEFEETAIQEDGIHTSIVQKFPLFNEEGKIYALGGIATDITERKREESARLYSEERYRVVVEAASDAVISLDEDGTIQLANSGATGIFGYTPSELIGKPLTLLMPESLRHLHEAGLRRYLATGKRHINWQGTELMGLRKSGEEFPIEVSFGELVHGGQRFFTGFIRDISERKRAEIALRRSEAYLAEAQRLSHTGSWHWNVRTMDVIWSKEFYSIFGLDPETTKPSYDLFLDRIHPEDRSRVAEARRAAAQTKRDYEAEYRLLLPGGVVKHLHSVGHCVISQTGDIEYIGAIMDITGRKRAEAERERLRETLADIAHINRLSTMGELTASLAHEIKQPMFAAAADAETCLRWLERDQLDVAEAQQAALRLMRDVSRASDIINRIVSLFKKDVPKRELVDVNGVIQEMIALLRSEASRRSISVHGDLAEGLPGIMADRVALQQVLMNLMLNAFEAMKEMNSPGRLTITTSQDENRQVLVSVTDTGVGLPPGQAEQVFNAFFTSKPQGTGMGLPISRSIIESHGGRLWARSNSGPGATFYFTLPLESAERQSA